MKKCLNCQSDVREEDTYCRNCGIKLEDNRHFVLINVLTFFVIIGIVLLILLFITSYMIGR